jgi:hypothetical protein
VNARRWTSPRAVAATAAAVLTCGALTIAGARSGTAAPAHVDGAELFRAKGCVGCHSAPGSQALIGIAPDLRLLSLVADHRVAGLSGRAYVRQSIQEPQAFLVPAYDSDGYPLMPALPLSPAEIDALVAYLLA